MPTIWDTARLRAGQNNTTVKCELARLQKRAVAARQRKKLQSDSPRTSAFGSRWARGEEVPTRLPYAEDY